MVHKLSKHIILLSREALKQGKATFFPLFLVVKFPIGKPDRQHKIDQ